MTLVTYLCSGCAGAINEASPDNVLVTAGSCGWCGALGRVHRVEDAPPVGAAEARP